MNPDRTIVRAFSIPPALSLLGVALGTALLLHPQTPELVRAVAGTLRPEECQLYESAGHFAVLLTMTGLLLNWSGAAPGSRRCVIAAAACYAIAAEYAQLWTPGRKADIGDALCNLCGVAAAVGVARVFETWKKKIAAISPGRHPSEV